MSKKTDKAAASDELLRLDKQLCFPLYAAANLIVKLYAPLLAEIDLTYPQYLVLLVLWEQSPLSVGELGTRLYLDSGTLTPLLKRLEAKELIDRRRDENDERRVLIYLSAKGKTLKKHAACIPMRLIQDLDLDVEEVAAMRETMKNFVTLLEKQLKSAEL